jgi:hypothetical protein
VVAALPLLAAFAVGLGTRRWLQRHFRLIFRIQFALGLGVLAVLAGWSFDATPRNAGAMVLLLAAQLTAVAVAERVFRAHRDGALMAFAMYGNPAFWALPIATATLGARAAVFLVAYDMLTQPRIALGLKLLRTRAPLPQSAGTAVTDYAPAVCAVAGLLLGRFVPAPDALSGVVAGLGIAMAIVGSLLLGVAWPSRWIGRPEAGIFARVLALHMTVVPAFLVVATLAGMDLPGAVWFMALGPLPTSLVSFAKLYGYSSRVAATSLGLSFAWAAVLLPVAALLAGS